MSFPLGKLPLHILRDLLTKFPTDDPSVLLGGAIGEDAAVIDAGGPDVLVVTSDPITFTATDAGRSLLAVNANDLATRGATPHWLLVTALLPEGIGEPGVRALFASIASACVDARVALVGGHTEITTGIDRPLLVGTLIGTAPRNAWFRTADAQVGDVLLLTTGIAIEGTAILAGEHSRTLLEAGVTPDQVTAAASLAERPGIRVRLAAHAACAGPGVHAMHDPTEGGLVSAVHEMCDAAGVGVEVVADAILVLPETRVICDALGLDPLGLLASGALLAAVDPAHHAQVAERLHGSGIPATVIGRLLAPSEGRVLRGGSGDQPLPTFARDELARFLANPREGPG